MAATVDVWTAPLTVPASVQVALLAALGPAERARAERFHRPDEARRFSVGRGWLRQIVGAAAGVPPAELVLVEDGGKPRLEHGPHFNLSRAGNLVVIAVAERDVGVDVEDRARAMRSLDAAGVACTAEEATELELLPPGGPRAAAFLALWTAKEAYLKATGAGLAVPPDRVHVGLRRPSPVAGGWWVRELAPGPGYVGAVAAQGTDWTVRLRPASSLLSVTRTARR